MAYLQVRFTVSELKELNIVDHRQIDHRQSLGLMPTGTWTVFQII